MAFPQTAAPTETSFGTNATAHLVTMPATVDAGDLLLVFFSNDGDATVATPSNWNLLASVANGNSSRGSVYYKIAVGNEDGTTVDFVTSASEKAAAQVYRVTAWHGTTPPEISTATTDTTANPDPGSLSPSWGAADTLWFAVFGSDGTESVSVYPTSYLNGVVTTSGTANDSSTASARRELNASSDDPSAFTMSLSEQWIAYTVAVRPAAGGNTGTIAVTQANQTAAMSGSVANPITGTMAASQGDQAGAIAGSLNISGTVGATQAPNVGAINGTVANPITGTIGVTQADDTGAFTGDVVSDGTLNAIQANQTGAINGTVVNPITGVLDATQEDDAGAFTGISMVSITGTLAAIEGDDTAAFAGDSTSPTVTGTIAVTQEDDSGAFAGDIFGVVVGSLAAIQADQTMTATGTTPPPVVTPPGSVVCVIGGPTVSCTLIPMTIIAGSNVVITATFRNADGDLADPVTVGATVQAPDGTQTNPVPTSSSTGIWTTVVPTDQAGFWFYQITGVGNQVDVVCRGSFCAEASLVTV